MTQYSDDSTTWRRNGFGPRIALTFEGTSWSFEAVKDEIDQIARGLMRSGVAAGEHVCLWLGNQPEFVFAFFPVAKIGAVPVPINSRFRSADMAYVLAQSDGSTLISAGRTERTDYLSMLREVLPEPDTLPGSAAFPRLRRVIVVDNAP